jgi:REP element-mobilizing transposase RayT
MKNTPISHHRRSIRIQDYDYKQEGMYFVTICTHHRKFLFGEIDGEKMITNALGEIVQFCWDNIPEHFPHAKPGVFVIMPNHLHGIIIIDDYAGSVEKLSHGTSKTLGSIVRGFKTGVTQWARNNTNLVDIWQSNYYERIIRDEKECRLTAEYIINNPLQWSLDYLNPKCRNSKILPF